jgi:hypothetical protein
MYLISLYNNTTFINVFVFYRYYLTTVEAGLEHIKSGKLTEESNKANIVVSMTTFISV